MDNPSTSPPLKRHLTIASRTIRPPAGFLPLSDSFYNPRGSALPSLIRSNAINRAMSIHDGDGSDNETGKAMKRTRSVDNNIGGTGSAPDSMRSEPMRSMRLIGNSNPRYNW